MSRKITNIDSFFKLLAMIFHTHITEVYFPSCWDLPCPNLEWKNLYACYTDVFSPLFLHDGDFILDTDTSVLAFFHDGMRWFWYFVWILYRCLRPSTYNFPFNDRVLSPTTMSMALLMNRLTRFLFSFRFLRVFSNWIRI